ncbi:putative defense protein 1 [Dendronephthya gigantea]|uniref:putative defense protein 1 n=1 Tax=Dendronephthya gigantea TaxID=151771 RepID=UPI00106C8B30|nr:putative defense protein 1 [Dendronephthya gigantea]
MNVLQLVIICLTGRVVFGKPDGAPTKSCYHMQPDHKRRDGFPPLVQTRPLDTIPYQLRAKIEGGFIRLFITGSESEYVAGFLIQARESERGKPIGKFESSDLAKYQECDKDDQYPEFSSITHKDSSRKKMNITFLWSPAEPITKNITVRFYATLAKNHETFWLRASSNEIYVLDLKNGAPGQHSFFFILSSLTIFLTIDLSFVHY